MQSLIHCAGGSPLNIPIRTGLVGFLLALSTVQPSEAAATRNTASNADSIIDSAQLIESRLARLSTAVRQRENLLPQGANLPKEVQIAGAFLNSSPWRNGGWFNGGGFLNSRPWVNGGWINGGGWRNGGGFWNF